MEKKKGFHNVNVTEVCFVYGNAINSRINPMPERSEPEAQSICHWIGMDFHLKETRSTNQNVTER